MHSSEVNGMVRKCNHSYLIRECEFIRPSECPTCHLAFFTPRHIVLSPPKEVLLWFKNYLLATLNTNRKPLYEVWSLTSDVELRFVMMFYLLDTFNANGGPVRRLA